MRFQSALTESINDKAIFKALFVAGYPGSGKTTMIRRVHDGSLPVMQVNSDIWTEYYMKFDRTAWSDISSLVTRHSLSNVYFHLNSLLPLYVDSTGANPANFKRRVEVLEQMGYDTKMILVDVELQTSLDRAKGRADRGGRDVPADVVKSIYDKVNRDRGMYKRHIPNFKTVKNNDGEWTEAIGKKVYNEVFSFFSSPVKNPIGKKMIAFMKKNGYKYYNDIPESVKKENDMFRLDKSTLGWYG